MKHRALIAFALLRGNLFGGMFDFGVCTRHMGKASFRKEGRYGALRSRDWEHMGWRRECDCEGQLSLTIGKCLQLVLNLLGGLVSKSLPRGRTGAGQRHGQWGTKELEGAW